MDVVGLKISTGSGLYAIIKTDFFVKYFPCLYCDLFGEHREDFCCRGLCRDYSEFCKAVLRLYNKK